MGNQALQYVQQAGLKANIQNQGPPSPKQHSDDNCSSTCNRILAVPICILLAFPDVIPMILEWQF